MIPAWPPIAGEFISKLAAWLDTRIRSTSIPIAAGTCFLRSGSATAARDAGSSPRRTSYACIGSRDRSCTAPISRGSISRWCGAFRTSGRSPADVIFRAPAGSSRSGARPARRSAAPPIDDLAARGFKARERWYDALDLTVARRAGGLPRRPGARGCFAGGGSCTSRPASTSRRSDRCRAQRRGASSTFAVDVPMLLFGAMDGDHHQPQRLRTAAPGARPVRANAFGTRCRRGRIRRRDEDEAKDVEGLPLIHIGKISDQERLARLYAAADVLVAPFIEDNLPNVVLEALSCGTPVVAFAAGGIPDAVEHQHNGVLVPVGDADALAEGIAWALDPVRKPALDAAARATALSRFDIAQCARAYRDLFAEIIADRAARHSIAPELYRTATG